MTFYTYLWLRENGTPYYVGKGHDKRAYRKGSPPLERILVQSFPSEVDAFEAEKFLISYYGRKDLGTGILINRSDGGQGNAGKIFTKEYREKISRARIGKKISLAASKRLSLFRKGKKRAPTPPEVKEKISNSLKGHPHSLERIRHISEGRRGKGIGRVVSAETRKKIGEANRRAHERRSNTY